MHPSSDSQREKNYCTLCIGLGWPWKATSAFNCLIINTEELFKHASSLGNSIVTFRFISIFKKYLKRMFFDWFFLRYSLFNIASTATVQIPLSWRMLGMNPRLLRIRQWQSDHQARSHPLTLQYISFTIRLDLISSSLKITWKGKKRNLRYATMLRSKLLAWSALELMLMLHMILFTVPSKKNGFRDKLMHL
jgi:hypothetical protein